MNIRIKDDLGLGIALRMAGYSQEERTWARDAIRDQFERSARKVFQEVLERPLPETVVVLTALSERDELKGEKAARLASYNLLLSAPNRPLFTINEFSVKELLGARDIKAFEGTTIHEMLHAADRNMLFNDYQLFQKIQNRISSGYDYFEQIERNHSIALLQTLRMFNRYRAEGLAVLGENLLMRTRIIYHVHPLERFRNDFLSLMFSSCTRAEGSTSDYNPEIMNHNAYKDAPFILLLILDKRGLISHELTSRAIDSISGKCFRLTDEEVKTIIRLSVDLGLSGFIHGLMLLGDEVAPIMPFLYFCGKLQEEFEKSNAEAFAQLIEQPELVDTFDMAIKEIMGCCIPEDELDRLYQYFIDRPLDIPDNQELKKRISALYSILKDDPIDDRKLLSQWALTYFFDDEDLIHDDISVIGYVDDMIILDYAINLLD